MQDVLGNTDNPTPVQNAPVWAIGTMVVINTLTNAVLAPIWALLTTHLYIERAGIEQNAVAS